MKIIGLIDEDFVNYKKPSMTVMFPYCSFKCTGCQNASLAGSEKIKIDPKKLAQRYANNPITEAVVCQGLEPLDSFEDLLSFVHALRNNCSCEDDIVIYTGYNKEEIFPYVNELSNYKNIIIKFGRYVPNQDKHYDEVLGVYLASDNQYAEKIS